MYLTTAIAFASCEENMRTLLVTCCSIPSDIPFQTLLDGSPHTLTQRIRVHRRKKTREGEREGGGGGGEGREGEGRGGRERKRERERER